MPDFDLFKAVDAFFYVIVGAMGSIAVWRAAQIRLFIVRTSERRWGTSHAIYKTQAYENWIRLVGAFFVVDSIYHLLKLGGATLPSIPLLSP